MSPQWSELGLARAARAKAENCDSAEWGKAEPLQAEGPAATSFPVRRVLHPSWMSSAFRRNYQIRR